MNFYIVVEGARTEKTVFSNWIPQLNPDLKQVEFAAQLVENNFVIFSGYGYPNYLKIVRDAATDVTKYPQYGTLVVSVDAEDDNPDHKLNMVTDVILEVNPHLNPCVIIQNACIENWFLGNRRAIRRFPNTDEARRWKEFYDVWSECPELMPADTEYGRNRAQTALACLVDVLRDRDVNMRYSKHRPDVVCHPTYLDQLKRRRDVTGHLQSFQTFVHFFEN